MRFFLIITLLFLAGCAVTAPDKGSQCPITPMPDAPPEPDDDALRSAVMSFLKSSGAPVSSSYAFTRVDLNGDRRRDAIVLFKTPYGYWCGAHGCTMLVFKAHDTRFSMLSSIQPVREPVYVSYGQTNGWNDLIARVSGRWDKAKNVALRFDGSSYPANPSNQPPLLRFDESTARRLFENAYAPTPR